MGYTTDFYGRFDLDRALAPEHRAYLKAFNETRRVNRDAGKTTARPDPVREAAGLPVGSHGSYFVGEGGFMGQNSGHDVLDNNHSPPGQPGLWCHWTPSEDSKAIEWDGGEKFYDYVEWLQYLLNHFLIPWGYVLNGEVTWEGEERHDTGKILLVDNRLFVNASELEVLSTAGKGT